MSLLTDNDIALFVWARASKGRSSAPVVTEDTLIDDDEERLVDDDNVNLVDDAE